MLEGVVNVLDTLEAEGTCVSHFKLKSLGLGNPGHKGFSYLAQDLNLAARSLYKYLISQHHDLRHILEDTDTECSL
jgi:hypothetical protein